MLKYYRVQADWAVYFETNSLFIKYKDLSIVRLTKKGKENSFLIFYSVTYLSAVILFLFAHLHLQDYQF